MWYTQSMHNLSFSILQKLTAYNPWRKENKGFFVSPHPLSALWSSSLVQVYWTALPAVLQHELLSPSDLSGTAQGLNKYWRLITPNPWKYKVWLHSILPFPNNQHQAPGLFFPWGSKKKEKVAHKTLRSTKNCPQRRRETKQGIAKKKGPQNSLQFVLESLRNPGPTQSRRL